MFVCTSILNNIFPSPPFSHERTWGASSNLMNCEAYYPDISLVSDRTVSLSHRNRSDSVEGGRPTWHLTCSRASRQRLLLSPAASCHTSPHAANCYIKWSWPWELCFEILSRLKPSWFSLQKGGFGCCYDEMIRHTFIWNKARPSVTWKPSLTKSLWTSLACGLSKILGSLV